MLALIKWGLDRFSDVLWFLGYDLRYAVISRKELDALATKYTEDMYEQDTILYDDVVISPFDSLPPRPAKPDPVQWVKRDITELDEGPSTLGKRDITEENT